MWILISFAMVALVLFIIMLALKIDVLVSIVISVLAGLIIAYFIDNIDITYEKDKRKNRDDDE
jgi:putative flippase GtrA